MAEKKDNMSDAGYINDYETLCAFSRSTKGTGWVIDSALDSSWNGILVEDGRVVRIDFGGKSEGSTKGRALEGKLPGSLWALTRASGMNLRSTLLSGRIPRLPTKPQLDKLQDLDLAYNTFEGDLPRLGLLPNLRNVYLHRNSLSGDIANAQLEECKSLRVANLSMNKLTGKIPAGFSDLHELIHLHLYQNELTGVIPAQLCTMRSLQVFFAANNAGLLLPPGTKFGRNKFKAWMNSIQKHDLQEMGVAPWKFSERIAPGDHDDTHFPQMGEQNVLREGALFEKKGANGDDSKKDSPGELEEQDKLSFKDYARVLVKRLSTPDTWPVSLGIYAQWGAGKSSLLKFILKGLEEIVTPPPIPRVERCLKSSILGSAIYEVFCGWYTSKNLGSGSAGYEPVTCIVASFDAWLFADSDVLWAVLVSKIFEQVEAHPCFGKGAVRYYRLKMDLAEISFEGWCLAALATVVVAGFAVAIGLAIEAIGSIDDLLTKALASVGLAGVPLSFILWAIKIMPAAFRSQGEAILNRATSMDASVGSTRLGFMADVQEEIQILLDMIKDRSTEKMKYALVVSIDNLDRCPHRNIVKVLEAVHLLLERDQANVIVLLALDPRVIIAAIEADLGEEVRKEVSGSEYLDKIIHWPFCVPLATKAQRQGLVKSWLGGNGPKPDGGDSEGDGGGGKGVPGNHGRAQQGRLHDSRILDGEAPFAADLADAENGAQHGPSGTSSAMRPSATGQLEKETDITTSIDDTKPPEDSGEATPNQQLLSIPVDQGSLSIHTPGEIEEFDILCKEIVTTPRKMKRILNIYGIQRALATRKGHQEFKSDSARKLLRWTVLCEFWPFRTACLVGSTDLAITNQDEYVGGRNTPLEFVYQEKTSEVIKTMLEQREVPREGISQSRAAARRLLGMDEPDEAFLRVLETAPKFRVGDFMEGPGHLGLLQFSINLNPAMVATVSAWARSEFS